MKKLRQLMIKNEEGRKKQAQLMNNHREVRKKWVHIVERDLLPSQHSF